MTGEEFIMSGAYDCVDCKVNTNKEHEYYMVWPEVWEEAGMTPRGGMLCIGCLEERLGRKLTARDFTNCEGNSLWYRSPRLNDRMTA